MVTETQYRQALNGLTKTAIRQIAALLRAVGSDDPVRVRNALIEYMPDLVIPHLTSAGELAATWYEDLRKVTGVTGYAQTADLPDQGRYESLARWGVRPLAGQSNSTVLSLVGGGVQRMVANAGRHTIDVNARADAGRGEIAATRWSRHSRADACEFCRMLAGRGPVYRSAAAAGAVIGRGSDRSGYDEYGNRVAGGIGGGVRARGAQELEADFHDHCRCVAKATFYRSEIRTVNVRGYLRQEPVLVPFAA